MKDEKENKEMAEVKKVVRSLLLSTQYGLTVSELCSEYSIVTCKTIPYRELGYCSPVDLIRDMPDVVYTVFQSGGAMLLKGVADKSTAHIRDLVRGQRSTGHKTKIGKPKQIPRSPPKPTVSSLIHDRIYKLIKNYSSGLAFRLFENAYMHEYSKRLNPQLHGYKSIRGLLEACTDIIKVEEKDGNLFVHPVIKSNLQKWSSSRTIPFLPMTMKYLSDNKVMNEKNMKPENIIPEAMKIKIFNVLLKRTNGMLAARFPFEFKEHHGHEFDVRSLGFNSVLEVMCVIPEIVVISRPTEKGDWLLTPKNRDDVINNGAKIITYPTKSPGNINDIVEIGVSYIIDPSLFWIQIITDFSELYELMEEMTNFYHYDAKLNYQLPEESMVPGQPCAALYDDDQWYRAVIHNVLSAKEVNVFYVDYGNEFDIETASLCILKEEYMKLPCQAFKAKLNVSPPYGGKWSKDSIEKFYELTCDQNLYATIMETEPILSVDIRDGENNDITSVFENKSISVHSNEDKTQKESEYQVSVNRNLSPVEDYKPIISNSSESDTYNCSPDSLVPNKVISAETNSELIKCLPIAENYSLHIIRYENTPYVLSTEISGLFWDCDILRQMLHQKDVDIKSSYLLSRKNEQLFAALDMYHVSGTPNGNITTSILSIYELTALPKIYSLFELKYKNAKIVILKEIQVWSNIINVEHYWCPVTQSNSSDEEEQSVESLLKLHALMFRKKRLYQMIFVNDHTASGPVS